MATNAPAVPLPLGDAVHLNRVEALPAPVQTYTLRLNGNDARTGAKLLLGVTGAIGIGELI